MESYNNMKFPLTVIRYEKNCGHIYGDLKVIALVLGLQPGYTKSCCFLGEWDSIDKKIHYQKAVAKEKEPNAWREKCFVSLM